MATTVVSTNDKDLRDGGEFVAITHLPEGCAIITVHESGRRGAAILMAPTHIDALIAALTEARRAIS